MENSLPLVIYDEKFLFERVQGHKEFHPQEISIIFIKKGKLEFAVNGENREYSKACILFISPRNIYQLKQISKDLKLFIIGVHSPYRNYISYSFNRFDVYRMIAVEQNNAIRLPEEDFVNLWGILKNIFYVSNLRKNTAYRKEIVIHSFSIIAYALVGHLEQLVISNQKEKPNNRKESITMNFMEVATQNFVQEKELKFYADKLFLSIKYLSICVKDVTGYPPTYFLSQLLVNEACSRLGDINLSIAELADDLKFSDQFSFSKFFKKNMRQTPSAFRKKISQTHTI